MWRGRRGRVGEGREGKIIKCGGRMERKLSDETLSSDESVSASDYKSTSLADMNDIRNMSVVE